MNISFVLTHADVWPTTQINHSLMNLCNEGTHNVTFIGCNGLLSRGCVAMQGAGIKYNSAQELRDQICRSCKIRRDVLLNANDASYKSIDEFVQSENRINARQMSEQITSDNWKDFMVGGINIGRLAAYEFMLEHKLAEEAIPEHLISAFQIQVENGLLTYHAARKYLSEEKVDRLIVSNHLYSVNNIFRCVAKQNDILTYGLHHGIDGSKKRNTVILSREVENIWDATQDLFYLGARTNPIDANAIKIVAQSNAELIQQRKYRVPKKRRNLMRPSQIRERISLSPNQKVLLCPTTSFDEIYAWSLVKEERTSDLKQEKMFTSQEEWLREIIRIAKSRKDLKFIIRVHPRELPNRREATTSRNVERLLEILDSTPPNVFVNWPEQDLTMYELLQITDVVLSGHSSVAGEAISLGIPVVCHEHMELLSYPSELTIRPNYEKTYEYSIDQAVSQGWNFERIRSIYRWKYYQLNQIEVELGTSKLYLLFSRISELVRYCERIYRIKTPRQIIKIVSRLSLQSTTSKTARFRILELINSGLESPQMIPNPTQVARSEDETKDLKKELIGIVRILPKYRADDVCVQNKIIDFKVS
jgi:hypothetical protein